MKAQIHEPWHFNVVHIFQYFVVGTKQQHNNNVFNCHFVSVQPIENEPNNMLCVLSYISGHRRAIKELWVLREPFLPPSLVVAVVPWIYNYRFSYRRLILSWAYMHEGWLNVPSRGGIYEKFVIRGRNERTIKNALDCLQL